jgi:hypothetical protein
VDKELGHSGSLWYILLEHRGDKVFRLPIDAGGDLEFATLTVSSSVARLSSSMGSQ